MSHFVNKGLILTTGINFNRCFVGKFSHRVLILEFKHSFLSQWLFVSDVEVHTFLFQNVGNGFGIGNDALNFLFVLELEVHFADDGTESGFQ